MKTGTGRDARFCAAFFLSFGVILAASAFAQRSDDDERGLPRCPVWTNRTGETVSATCTAITNQTVYLLLSSGGTRSFPLRIFPENEQLRMKLSLGVAPVPGCLVPAWRLFEDQLASARDAESTRASLGFMVKQVTKQEADGAVSSAEAKYWIARALEKERAARQALFEKETQPEPPKRVSAAPQQEGE